MPKRRVVRHSVTQPLNESYRFIALTRGQNAIVDAEDFDSLSKWNWYAYWCPKTRSFIAGRVGRTTRGEKHSTINMAREILGLRPGNPLNVDHKNHNTLDNRRENLRKCRVGQNSRNRTKHTLTSGGKLKGVYWRTARACWVAQIQIRKRGKRKTIHIGRFFDAVAAAKAYDEAAKRLHGEFASLNFS